MKISIVIRFSDAGAGTTKHPDLTLPLSVDFSRDDVNKLVNSSWLKQMVRSKMPGTERRRLRLIYNGRIINDQTDFRKEVFDPKLKQLKESFEPENALKLYVHCLIGDKMTREQLEQEKELDGRAQVGKTDPPVIGFDRLLLQGMSVLDVNDLRRQFQQVYFPDSSQNRSVNSGVADMEEDENRQQYIREQEERWLDSTNGNGPANASSRPSARAENRSTNDYGDIGNDGPANLAERAAADLEGTHHNENLLVGLLLGTFLGAVALVFLAMDDSLFNDAQKMAMILGISINLFIAFMRVGSEYSA